jgi:hypothetical protein
MKMWEKLLKWQEMIADCLEDIRETGTDFDQKSEHDSLLRNGTENSQCQPE